MGDIAISNTRRFFFFIVLTFIFPDEFNYPRLILICFLRGQMANIIMAKTTVFFGATHWNDLQTQKTF